MRSPASKVALPVKAAPGNLGGGQSSDGDQTASASSALHWRHGESDTQVSHAPVNTLPPANGEADSKGDAPGADLGTDQSSSETRLRRVGADLNGDRAESGNQKHTVAEPEGNDQSHRDAQGAPVAPSDALLTVLADSLNDIEGLRKATRNQLSALTRSSDVPGGKGLSEFSRAAVSLADRLALLEQVEHQTVLDLQRAMRAHPLGSWVEGTVGIGLKQGARLIAAIGDPYWNHAESRPRRGPAELWAYCGYAPGQKRRKGVQSNWNAEAKMRAFLCAESCIKQTGGADDRATSTLRSRRRSPYRDVYDQARIKWGDRDTSDAHKHQHALRCVAKAILKDLWLAARAKRASDPNGETPASANGGAA